MSFASMTLNVLKILVVGFTLELQVWCKGPCNCNLLWVWRGNHGNFCSSKKPKFPTKDRLHHTWEHTWPKTDMDAICTMCMLHWQRFQDSDERRDRDWQLLPTSVQPCFLQSDLRFPSALESSAYLKLTSLLVWSQQLSYTYGYPVRHIFLL